MTIQSTLYTGIGWTLANVWNLQSRTWLGYWIIITLFLTAGSIVHDAYYWERVGFRAAWVSVTQVPFIFLLAGKVNAGSFFLGSSYMVRDDKRQKTRDGLHGMDMQYVPLAPLADGLRGGKTCGLADRSKRDELGIPCT